MLSNDRVFINGVSSDSIDIYVDTPPVPAPAVRRYNVYSTGSDEDTTIPDETYEDVPYELTCYDFKKPSDYSSSSKVYEFFQNAKTLTISRYPGVYFKVRQVVVYTETEYDANRIRYRVSFLLAPFKYLSENPEITIDSGDFVKNEGNRYSKPTFYINATGDITLEVNGERFQITLDGYNSIVVECGKYAVFKDGKLLTCVTSGKFPFLAPGQNRIVYSGSVQSFKLKVNARCY